MPVYIYYMPVPVCIAFNCHHAGGWVNRGRGSELLMGNSIKDSFKIADIIKVNSANDLNFSFNY